MKATGVGMREMGRVAIDFYTELKAVYIDSPGASVNPTFTEAVGTLSGPLVPETVRASSLYNKDLASVSPERRSWRTYNYAALWISMSVNIPTYMLASGMIAGGMNWKQALFTVFLGNVLVLIPMLLNAHAGAQYGIPFPVFARASFGVLGANVPRFCAPS